LPQQGPVHTFTFGEVAQYRCQGGEVEITYECQANGQFSITSQFSTCQNTCGAPSIPDHAHRVDGVGDVVHPMSASWTCDPGFTHLAGGVAPDGESAVSQMCQASGVFQSVDSQCTPITCQRPNLPANWEYVNDATFNTQSVALLRCNVGYQMAGVAASQVELTCNPDGDISDLPEPCELETFQLSGRIISAVDITVALTGVQMLVGDISTTSSSSGHYRINLPAGQHALTLSVDGYITYEGTVTMVSQDTGSYDFHMSPLLGPDSFRIVLTWGDIPTDLDSHLQFGDNVVCPEVYYPESRQVIECGGVTGRLDVDNVVGLGPETVTLSNLNSCSESLGFAWNPFAQSRCEKWTYRVKNYAANYANLQPGGYNPITFAEARNNGWAESEAVVTLYNGDHIVATYRVSDVSIGGHGFTTDDGRGVEDDPDTTQCELCLNNNRFWNVFSIDSNGQVSTCTNVNCD